MFKRILVANRGEIAMRIIRCCKEMGIDTVLAVSEEDKDSLPAHFATHVACIGPAPATQSYLNKNALVATAIGYKCDAVHPGYGFLAENADFARLCEENGISFIGPNADIINKMGDKNAAKSLMRKKGVPVVPGSEGILKSADEAKAIANKVGYPVLLKASAGGGGRGMRIANREAEIDDAFKEATAEAAAAFGNPALYLEKLIKNPKHIEVQILADKAGHTIHLGERDCSIQRRNQKLLEEGPASSLTKTQRAGLHAAAVKAAKAAGYYSAGTIEFVVDREGKYYFIEMNTRIQVEHCITEMLTGVDLIREQIRIADGRDLLYKQSDIHIKGHAIECRITAEAPERNFAPCPGTVDFVHFPGGNGTRIESAMFSGAKISPYYDSMIAKVIVHAPTRLRAIKKMRSALSEMAIEGVETNTNFLYLVMYSPDFVTGNFDTSFLAKYTDLVLKFDKESRKRVK